MTMKKKRLGRGLGSLIGNLEEVTQVSETDKAEGLTELGVDQIQRGKYQPRQHFDQQALQELADSIHSQGIIQPLVVRAEGSHYELIAGERRWRAAQLAGLQTVPVVIRELDSKSAAAIALIENIQREDLNPLEESQALMHTHPQKRMQSISSEPLRINHRIEYFYGAICSRIPSSSSLL